ncbi:MAG: HypC/HybG/HupF family hydrogenase formation chaperone [Clostridia bacterium]|nr:HypC/HybG/HupF family hydrogenase formation chaperone [Clostridia bacterium]
MCLAIPGEVLEIKDKKAVISVMGAKTEVSIELLENVKIGDYLIVHAGCAIAIVDEKEAMETIELFRELGEITNGKV